MIELLVELDADIECRTKDGATPLLMAVGENQTYAVSVLLRHQANVSAQDTSGWGVLHYAVHKSADDLMRILLYRDPMPDVNCKSVAGSTPLHLAAERTLMAAAQLLLESGADVEAQDISSRKRTPLFLAVSKPPNWQREAFVSLLLDHNAIVDRTRLPSTARNYDLREPYSPPLDRTDSGFFSIGSISRRNSGTSTLTSASRMSAFSRRFSVRRRNSAQ